MSIAANACKKNLLQVSVKCYEGLVQFAVDRVLGVLLRRVVKVQRIHRHQVRQPPWTRRGKLDLRLVFVVSGKFEALPVPGVLAEALKAGDKENF